MRIYILVLLLVLFNGCNDEIEANNNQLKQMNRTLTDKISVLNKQVIFYKSTFEELKENIKKKKELNKNLESNSKDKIKESKELEKENLVLNKQLNLIQAKYQVLNEKLNDKDFNTNKSKELEAENLKLNKKLNLTEIKYQALNEKINDKDFNTSLSYIFSFIGLIGLIIGAYYYILEKKLKNDIILKDNEIIDLNKKIKKLEEEYSNKIKIKSDKLISLTEEKDKLEKEVYNYRLELENRHNNDIIRKIEQKEKQREKVLALIKI